MVRGEARSDEKLPLRLLAAEEDADDDAERVLLAGEGVESQGECEREGSWMDSESAAGAGGGSCFSSSASFRCLLSNPGGGFTTPPSLAALAICAGR
jgi:hypothetical protein